MCYDLATLTKKKKVYAKRFGLEADSVEDVEKLIQPIFHTNGFTHPILPVITNEQQGVMQAFEWGLIPHWAKDPVTAVKISNQTLNARIETITDKASFKNSAGKKHCIIIVDGFYEHHHHNGKPYPFFIQRKDEEPFAIAGLWETWQNKKEGIRKSTVTLITGPANTLMSKIHNNPKVKAPRMPLVLNEEQEKRWLDMPDKESNPDPSAIITDNADELPLTAYPVGKLRGKAYVGNQPAIQQEEKYTELKDFIMELESS